MNLTDKIPLSCPFIISIDGDFSRKRHFSCSFKERSIEYGGMDETYQKVEEVLDKIRPFLRRDGGDIDLIGIKDGIVYVAMTGACEGCAMASDDIVSGVDIIVCEEVPGITMVDASGNVPEDVLNEYFERKKQAGQLN